MNDTPTLIQLLPFIWLVVMFIILAIAFSAVQRSSSETRHWINMKRLDCDLKKQNNEGEK